MFGLETKSSLGLDDCRCYDPDSRGPLFLLSLAPSILFPPAPTPTSFSSTTSRALLTICSIFPALLRDLPFLVARIPGLYLSKDSRPCHCRLVKVAAPHVYKLVLYLELGLKPDLVHNPSVASAVFSVASFTICFTLILFSLILTIRLRLRLSLPLQITLVATLEY